MMKKFICLLVLLLTILLPISSISAQSNHVFDNAGIIDSDDELSLTDLCIKLGNKYKVKFIVYTELSTNGFTQQDVADKIDDYYEQDYYNEDVIITMIMVNSSTNPTNRKIQYFCYNKAKNLLSFSNGESALDDAVEAFVSSNENFYVMLDAFLNSCSKKINSNILWNNTKPHLLIGGIGLISGALLITGLIYKSSAKDTVNNKTYENDPKILGRYDRYVRTVVTRVPKPKSSSGSGGSSRAGGSGGGRSF